MMTTSWPHQLLKPQRRTLSLTMEERTPWGRGTETLLERKGTSNE